MALKLEKEDDTTLQFNRTHRDEAALCERHSLVVGIRPQRHLQAHDSVTGLLLVLQLVQAKPKPRPLPRAADTCSTGDGAQDHGGFILE